jgi:hypothetical protein
VQLAAEHATHDDEQLRSLLLDECAVSAAQDAPHENQRSTSVDEPASAANADSPSVAINKAPQSTLDLPVDDAVPDAAKLSKVLPRVFARVTSRTTPAFELDLLFAGLALRVAIESGRIRDVDGLRQFQALAMHAVAQKNSGALPTETAAVPPVAATTTTTAAAATALASRARPLTGRERRKQKRESRAAHDAEGPACPLVAAATSPPTNRREGGCHKTS